MARIDWIEQRLLNWQRWRLTQGGGCLGYAAVDLSNPTPEVREAWAEAPIPTNEIEASETEDAVQKLWPGELKATVIEYYVGPGNNADHLRRLVCSKATLYDRLERADRQLAEHFSAKRRRQDRERERVEQLQRTAAPGGFTH